MAPKKNLDPLEKLREAELTVSKLQDRIQLLESAAKRCRCEAVHHFMVGSQWTYADATQQGPHLVALSCNGGEEDIPHAQSHVEADNGGMVGGLWTVANGFALPHANSAVPEDQDHFILVAMKNAPVEIEQHRVSPSRKRSRHAAPHIVPGHDSDYAYDHMASSEETDINEDSSADTSVSAAMEHTLYGRAPYATLSSVSAFPRMFTIPLGGPHSNVTMVPSALEYPHTASFIYDEIASRTYGVKRSNPRSQWDRVKPALLRYKELKGDLLVPMSYKIEEGNRDYPKELWGLHLGRVVGKIRMMESYKDRRDELLEMGFRYDRQQTTVKHPGAYGWDAIKLAFQLYKQHEGHMKVPKKFVVPEDPESWPPHLFGMRLGIVFDNIKYQGGYRQHHDELISMGFPFRSASTSG
jgi:hypothetical protein